MHIGNRVKNSVHTTSHTKWRPSSIPSISNSQNRTSNLQANPPSLAYFRKHILLQFIWILVNPLLPFPLYPLANTVNCDFHVTERTCGHSPWTFFGFLLKQPIMHIWADWAYLVHCPFCRSEMKSAKSISPNFSAEYILFFFFVYTKNLCSIFAHSFSLNSTSHVQSKHNASWVRKSVFNPTDQSYAKKVKILDLTLFIPDRQLCFAYS